MAKDPKYAYAHDKSKNVAFLCQWTNFYNAYGVIKAYGGYVFGNNNTNPKQLGLDTPGAVDGIKVHDKLVQYLAKRDASNNIK